jgi:hypothetical protein
MDIVQHSVGHSAKNWGTLLADRIPGINTMNDSLLKKFMVKFLVKRSALMVGKVAPAGIGAAIGGFGNRALGRGVIDNAHAAFGPPSGAWPGPDVIDAEPLPGLYHRNEDHRNEAP